MSAFDQLREFMSTARDLVQDYDTDAVSVTSTLVPEEKYYSTNCIIAEAPGEENRYLVSWEDYPLDESTWEPPANLDGTDLISKWEQVKQELGTAAFQRENEKNIIAYEEAEAKAGVAKARRHAKREQTRRRLQRRKHVVVSDNSSDEEPSPLAQRGDSLFVEDHPPSISASSANGSSRARHPPVTRRPPLQQSSSEEESSADAQRSNDTRKSQPHDQRASSGENRSVAKRSKGSPVLQKQKLATAASATTSKVLLPRDKSMQHSSIPAAYREGKNGITAGSFITSKPKDKRKRVCSYQRQYNKLKLQGLAEKRFRTEATPDFSALTFVNSTLSKFPETAATRSDDILYGRREYTNRRTLEENQDDRPRRELGTELTPLATWEVDKVPLICSHWYRAACPHGAQKCHLMHRKVDPQGQPYAIADNEGRVIHKYRKPPLTCLYWYNGRRCYKTAEQCLYAHKDTGWVELNGVPIKTDHLPPSLAPAARGGPSHSLPPKLQNTPMTCHYWLEGQRGCRKKAAECRFSHSNTGWIVYPNNPQPKWINPEQQPRFRKKDPTEISALQIDQSIPSVKPAGTRTVEEPAVEASDQVSANKKTDAMQVQGRQDTQSLFAIQGVSQKALAVAPTSLRNMIEQFWNLDIVDMFNSGVPGDNDTLERQAMLLYHPEEHREEIDLITRWLLLHGVRIANLWYDGAWNQFQEDVATHKSGVIIAHPEFEHYVDLPGFGDVLKRRVRVWSVGLQLPAWYEFGVDPSPPELRHDRIGILPHGGFIYITDDVFEQKPQLALSIIKLFFAKIEHLRSLNGPVSPWLEVDDACLLWRLCVRPELMDYLYTKCKDGSVKLANGNPEHRSRADLYQLLTLTNYIEQDHPLEPLSAVQDKYPILSERREIAEHPPLDYFSRLANSQEDANTHMIGYYATMQSADMRRAYRQFYVVHTEPEVTCARQWKESIHNIADIITPEQCVDELSRPSNESLFDFLDWAMSQKEKLDADPEREELREVPLELSHSKEIQEVEHTAY